MSNIERYIKFYSEYFNNLDERNSEDEVSVRCPFHDDRHASMHINLEKGVWHCKVCSDGDNRGHGNEYDFYQMIMEESGEVITREEAKEDVERIIGIPREKIVSEGKCNEEKIIPESEIDDWFNNLKNNERALSYLHEKRGISNETINRFMIGYDEIHDRYIIPIRNKEGQCVNVRKYSISGKPKMLPYAIGYGHNRLFPINNIECDDVLLCEGEWDALLAIQNGFNGITFTGGANSKPKEYAHLFTDKKVAICYDNDKAGKDGANGMLVALEEYAMSVKIIGLPVDEEKEDITDYFVKYKYNKEDLRKLIEDHPILTGISDNILEVPFDNSQDPEYEKKIISYEARVLKVGSETSIPRTISMSCDADGKACNFCPVCSGNYNAKVKLLSEFPIKMYMEEEEKREKLTNKHFGVKCNNVTHEWQDLIRMRRIIIDDGNSNGKINTKVAYTYVEDVEEFQEYKFRGTYVVSPKKGDGSVNILTDAEPLETTIDSFQYQDGMFDKLGNTKEDFWEAISDISNNIVEVFDRDYEMAMIVLTYLSPLQTYYRSSENNLQNSFAQLLMVGETSTGKTTMTRTFMDAVGLGEQIPAEGATLPGLTSATIITKDGTINVPGALPKNNKGLVILEEFSGLSREVLTQLTYVRSEGKVKSVKAGGGEHEARVRMIMISNPRGGSKASGAMIDDVISLVKSEEDLRRMDLAIGLKQIEINRKKQIEKKITPDMLRNLILFAWSRRPDQIIFTDDAIDKLEELGNKMSKKYVYNESLVTKSEQDRKMAKYAAAIAMLMNSRDETGECVIVDELHAEFTYELFECSYTSQDMGYKKKSILLRKSLDRAAKHDDEVIEVFEKYPMLENYLDSNREIKINVFSGYLNIDSQEANRLIRLLVSNMVLVLKDNVYRHGDRYSEFFEIYENKICDEYDD